MSNHVNIVMNDIMLAREVSDTFIVIGNINDILLVESKTQLLPVLLNMGI